MNPVLEQLPLGMTPEDQARFDKAASHPYSCDCPDCKFFWDNVPTEEK